MIRRISISDYALIRHISISPAEGFNAITGETGAGKSIILGALSLLQGGRWERPAASRGEDGAAIPSVEAEVVYADGSVHTLRRELLPSGRSKASLDGAPVTLARLAEAAAPLFEIHSQHQNLRLAESSFQLDTLDGFAANSELRSAYNDLYAQYRVALRRFADTRDEIARTDVDADYLAYQLQELSSAALTPGEDEQLESDHARLASSVALASLLARADALLSASEQATTASAAESLSLLRRAAEHDNRFEPVVQNLEQILDNLESVAAEVSSEASSVADDPARLDEVERRLSLIESLKAKHRCSSIDGLIELRDSLARRLEIASDGPALLHRLEQEARSLKRRTLAAAELLTESRRRAAASLSSLIEERARPLGMENLRVEIRVESSKLSPTGADIVNFLFAFNKNQQPAPLEGHASGGEISRVMLALKSITAERHSTPTLIFDEIDTGVSGDIAARMGALMADIASKIQVITITHLPAVAALAERHFNVFKRDDESATHTYIEPIEGEARRRALTAMLGTDPSIWNPLTISTASEPSSKPSTKADKSTNS